MNQKGITEIRGIRKQTAPEVKLRRL